MDIVPHRARARNVREGRQEDSKDNLGLYRLGVLKKL